MIKSPKLADPANTINVNKTKEKNTSYEIICAEDRSDPKNAYLELLDHPLKMIAYTPNDEIQNHNNALTLKFV